MNLDYFVNTVILHLIPTQVNKKPHKKKKTVYLNKFNLGQPIYPPELIQWFQLQKQESSSLVIKKQQKKTRYRLPAGWKVKDLPPSLKPPPSKHGYDWNNVGSWQL